METKFHVLILLDGSAVSARIVEPVVKLFPPERHRLTVLRVRDHAQGLVPHPPRTVAPDIARPMYQTRQDLLRSMHPIYASQVEESLVAEERHALQPLVRRLETIGYEVEVAVLFGEPVEEIVSYAAHQSIDLVAMATHGRTGIQQILFGSVAGALLRRLSLPFLVVRPFQ